MMTQMPYTSLCHFGEEEWVLEPLQNKQHNTNEHNVQLEVLEINTTIQRSRYDDEKA